MTDYKQLCAELHAALDKHDLSLAEDELLDRSAAALRAALAETEPDPFDVVQHQLDKLAGDEEMVIYRWSDGCWSIDHTNLSNSVKLGESNGKYESEGSSLKEAVINLKAILPGYFLT